MAKKEKAVKMTPEERRKFLMAPITITVFGSNSRWAGSNIADPSIMDRFYGRRGSQYAEPDNDFYKD